VTGQAGSGRTVIELDFGITVYPARFDGDRWRAVWHENGERQQCESVQEATLAVKLEKVTERLAADAPNMKRPGADLIAHYLDPDRLPVDKRWSRRHSDTQRRLCERFAAPVIITQPWHPVHVTSATELAALDFPQPVQASVLADAQSADAGARQDAPHLARNAVPGHPASQTF